MSRRRDIDHYEDYTFLGGKISEKIQLFKILAMLGYEEAEQYALMEYMKWFFTSPENTSPEVAIQKGIELMGMAHFLPLTAEITKLSMILGDTRKTRGYNE